MAPASPVAHPSHRLAWLEHTDAGACRSMRSTRPLSPERTGHKRCQIALVRQALVDTMRHGDVATFRQTHHQCDAWRRPWRGVLGVAQADDPHVLPGGRLVCGARRGYGPPSPRGWGCWAARSSASYSVVRFTPKVRQIAALLAPASRAVRIAVSFSSLMAWGRPPRFPRRCAAATPALMRSCVKARSYWASAPNT
jgi:hypothetical protein